MSWSWFWRWELHSQGLRSHPAQVRVTGGRGGPCENRRKLDRVIGRYNYSQRITGVSRYRDSTKEQEMPGWRKGRVSDLLNTVILMLSIKFSYTLGV